MKRDPLHPSRLYVTSFGGEVFAVQLNLDRAAKLRTYRASELKRLLAARNVNFADCFDKEDFVQKCVSRHSNFGFIFACHSVFVASFLCFFVPVLCLFLHVLCLFRA